MTKEMTKKDAEEWVRTHTDEDKPDPDDLQKAFVAIYGRRPDEDEDIWSLLCAATPE